MKTTYRGFEKLEVWKEARKLRQALYALSKKLPTEEKFVLLPQMRRAALSITNNIVEGHGRYHYQENAQFLRLARGSLEEVLDDLTVREDEGYVPCEVIAPLREQLASVKRLLNGYIRYLLTQKAATKGRDMPAAHLSDRQSPITNHRSP